MNNGEILTISTKEAAAMIRAALKVQFPAAKFSVRMKSFAGGSSIDVDWTDGPTQARVKQITRPFEQKGFDGMTDSTTYGDPGYLVDGVAYTKRDLLHLPADEAARAKPFRCYPWIHLNRQHSPALTERARAQVATFFGRSVDEIDMDSWQQVERGRSWRELVREAAEDHSRFAAAT